MFRALWKVSNMKAATQTCSWKLNHPHFNGYILNYLEFKKQWSNKIIPERRPAPLKLVARNHSIPAIPKAKIADVTMVAEAWKLLDHEYWQF